MHRCWQQVRSQQQASSHIVTRPRPQTGRKAHQRALCSLGKWLPKLLQPQEDMAERLERLQRPIRNTYDYQCRELGRDRQAVCWSSEYAQTKRFETLTTHWNMRNAHILDVGCGQADLALYLRNSQHLDEFRYTGIDFSPSMVKCSKEAFPEGHFEVADLFSYHPAPPPSPCDAAEPEGERPFDFVLASGIFSFELMKDDEEFQRQYVEAAIKRLFDMGRQGTALNFLSHFSPVKVPGLYYYDPCDILRFCFTLTQHVTLRAGYVPDDFTVFLSRTAP